MGHGRPVSALRTLHPPAPSEAYSDRLPLPLGSGTSMRAVRALERCIADSQRFVIDLRWLAGWTCDRMAELFPDVSIRWQYSSEDEVARLGSRVWRNAREPIDNGPSGSAGPRCKPLFVDPSEIGESRLQAVDRVPYPLEATEGNVIMLQRKSEFWISPSACAGAMAHMDTHAQMFVAATLGGSKRWRLSPPTVQLVPTFRGLGFEDLYFSLGFDSDAANSIARTFIDGAVDTQYWRPHWVGTVGAGEALFFPPAWVHETEAVSDGCTVSVTSLWLAPFATTCAHPRSQTGAKSAVHHAGRRYVRAYLPRLAPIRELQDAMHAYKCLVHLNHTWSCYGNLQAHTDAASNELWWHVRHPMMRPCTLDALHVCACACPHLSVPAWTFVA